MVVSLLCGLVIALIVLRPLRRLVWFASMAILIVFGTIVFVGNVVFRMEHTIAFRAGHPYSEPCLKQPQTSGRSLAEASREMEEKRKSEIARLRDAGKSVAADKLADAPPLDDLELAAVKAVSSAGPGLHCAVQTHYSPLGRDETGKERHRPYHLAFLEFQEDGNPQSIQEPSEKPPLSSHDAPRHPEIRSQLDALRDHLLRRRSNYVIVFVHGWRHNARLGDGNVVNLHRYAAHAARFIAERQKEGRFVGTEVTAVYVGWPGARVDERPIVEPFRAMGLGQVGEMVANVAAFMTLFDRKPISEQVAPYALSALRVVSQDLVARRSASPGDEQKMLVAGHSLGGNLLMTALGDHIDKSIERHQSGKPFQPPIGDLVVLINPASEASKWVRLQRAVWKRIAFKAFEAPTDKIKAGHTFFMEDQKPVLVSVTAARYWPPGGIRGEDCVTAKEPGARNLSRRLKSQAQEEARGLLYDFPTHVLFPTFRFDFRPAAEALEGWARKFSGKNPKDAIACGEKYTRGLLGDVALLLADGLKYFPFMNTDQETTRTIGHLEAPRPAFGNLIASNLPEKPFGTTHEVAGLRPRPMPQTSAGDKRRPLQESDLVAFHEIGTRRDLACPDAKGWLLAARRLKGPYGTQWDSADLGLRGRRSKNIQRKLDELGLSEVQAPAVQFVHGFVNSGRAPITRANDPFWNLRAYDNALSKHDGYVQSSFICGLQQIVLDNITERPQNKL